MALLPTLLGVWVGCTRISDYAHNYTDVAAGATIGVIIAYFYYSLHLQSLQKDGAEVPLSNQELSTISGGLAEASSDAV